MKPELVIFDMDGLMFGTEKVYYEECFETCRKHGIKVNEEIAYASIGTTQASTDNWFEIPDGLKVDIDKLLDGAIDSSIEKMCKKGIPIKPGLFDLLDTLDELGIPKVIATSTTRKRTEKLLKSAGIYDRFVIIVCGDEISRGKPYPDIFLKVCSKINIEPKAVIVFEDSNNGTLAAKNAGIPCVMVPDLVQPSDESAAYALAVLENLHQAAALMRTYFVEVKENSSK